MFNLAIDSKLRGCDVGAFRVEDVAPSGYAVDRATVRRQKTGRPVRFELTEQTRQAVDDYIKTAGKKPCKFLFSGRGDHNRCMTTRQYARLVSSWVAKIGPDIDVAVRHGDGNWPGLEATRLCAERIFAICSPTLSPAAIAWSGPPTC